MTVAPDAACPACRAPVTSGSAFCTRCGAPLAVREIEVVAGAAPQWGGAASRERGGSAARRRGRPRAAVAAPPAVGPAAGDVGLVAEWAGAMAAAGAAGAAGTAGSRGAALGAAFDGVTPASTGRRVAAYAIDLVTVLAVAAPVWWLTRSPVYAGLAAGELAAGLVVWEARAGQTVGNALLGLRTASVERPFAPGLGRAAGRAALLGAAHLVAGLGQWAVVASTALDRSGRGQAWHDRVAGTVVVDTRAMRVREPVVAPPVVSRAPAHAAPPAPASSPAPTQPAPPPTQPVSLVAPVAPAGPAAVATAYVLTLDTGRTVTVTGDGIIGRRPRPDDGAHPAHVVEVEDPGRSLSRTHAEFGVADGVFWVADRGSANGTFLPDAAGAWQRLEPARRYPVPPGAAVRMGERLATVTRA